MSDRKHPLASLSMVSLIFVHSAIDDADLSPSQFRVYAHLARRADGEGRARPGIESIAETCKLHPDTTRAAIKALRDRCMLEVQERPGLPRIYILTPPNQWQTPPKAMGDHPPEKKPPLQTGGVGKGGTTTPPSDSGDTPPKGMDTKVIQQGNPNKEEGAGGEFLKRAEVWTRCSALLHRPATMRRSYEEEEALAYSADITDHQMRQIERIHAIAANSPEKRITVRRKIVPLLRDLPGELALAAQHGLNGKATPAVAKPVVELPADWSAFTDRLAAEFPHNAPRIKAWKTWADAEKQLPDVRSLHAAWKGGTQ